MSLILLYYLNNHLTVVFSVFNLNEYSAIDRNVSRPKVHTCRSLHLKLIANVAAASSATYVGAWLSARKLNTRANRRSYPTKIFYKDLYKFTL